MLRFLFDPLGDAHADLVLKIDGLPGMAQVVDTYFLAELIGDKDMDEALSPPAGTRYLEIPLFGVIAPWPGSKLSTGSSPQVA